MMMMVMVIMILGGSEDHIRKIKVNWSSRSLRKVTCWGWVVLAELEGVSLRLTEID